MCCWEWTVLPQGLCAQKGPVSLDLKSRAAGKHVPSVKFHIMSISETSAPGVAQNKSQQKATIPQIAARGG